MKMKIFAGDGRTRNVVSFALGTLAVLSFEAMAQESTPTFSKDIAPILQRSCQDCHNPTGVGPMQLITYEQVRPWAPLIKDRTTKRIMPPWHVARDVGVQDFKNDVSLTDEEIALIAAWADAGAPEGNPADLPVPREYPTGEDWQLADLLGPPDVVIKSSPFKLAAGGQDQWWSPNTEFPDLGGERWLRASEFKPSYPLGRKVVHHGHANLVPDGDASDASGARARSVGLAHYGVGMAWDLFPEGTGMKVPAKGHVEWDMHYAPYGTEVESYVEVGLWFYPEGVVPEKQTSGEQLFRADAGQGLARGQDIIIPPHGQQVLQGTHLLETPVTINSFRPHMHMRGKLMSMAAIYPDGRTEVLSEVNRYNHNWQISYQFSDDSGPLLPAGTILQFTSVFDNSVNNPLNPDPEQWVLFGRRGVDEMSHAWVAMTYLNEEQYAEEGRRRAAIMTELNAGSE